MDSNFRTALIYATILLIVFPEGCGDIQDRVAQEEASAEPEASGAGREASYKNPAAARARVLEEARKLIGVREDGNNSGKVVDDILDASGLRGTRSPWCAAFNRFVYNKAGLWDVGPARGNSAWSPAWVAHPTWERGSGDTPQAGDPFGIYFRSKGRIAHTGLIEEWGTTVITIEGNTNQAGSREGDGVYRKRRSQRQIYSAQNWIGG